MRKVLFFSLILLIISCNSFSDKPTIKWKFKTDGWIFSSPAIRKDSTIYFGSHDNYLYALKSDRTLKWKYKIDDNKKSSPKISNEGTIYFGSEDCYFYALR